MFDIENLTLLKCWLHKCKMEKVWINNMYYEIMGKCIFFPLFSSFFVGKFGAYFTVFHTRAKCAIWMIMRILQFELRSVHTREVVAIFDYVVYTYTRDRICGLAFPSRRRCVARVWVPCQSKMHEARISCASVHNAALLYIMQCKSFITNK